MTRRCDTGLREDLFGLYHQIVPIAPSALRWTPYVPASMYVSDVRFRRSIRKSVLWDSVRPFDVIPGVGVGSVDVL